MTARIPHPILHVPVPLVFVLNYLAGIVVHFIAPVRLPWTPPVSLDTIGVVLFVAGALLAGWGWMTFHRAGTTRVPGAASTTLVTWGPYRFTRNPMYVGLSVAYLGEAALQHQLWPALLLPLTLAYLQWMIIPLEESRLRDVFGSAVDQYQARVRRWL
jgi:protein-S-isoprenylcysteine O-methyltransferase Ste14